MSDPVQALLAAGLVPGVSLPPTSRYAGVEVRSYVPSTAPGRVAVPVAHLGRRLVPRPDRLWPVREHTCVEGDRRDLVAAVQLGDPELWWRLADANGVLDPATMTPVGRVLRITLSEGIRGA